MLLSDKIALQVERLHKLGPTASAAQPLSDAEVERLHEREARRLGQRPLRRLLAVPRGSAGAMVRRVAFQNPRHAASTSPAGLLIHQSLVEISRSARRSKLEARKLDGLLGSRAAPASAGAASERRAPRSEAIVAQRPATAVAEEGRQDIMVYGAPGPALGHFAAAGESEDGGGDGNGSNGDAPGAKEAAAGEEDTGEGNGGSGDAPGAEAAAVGAKGGDGDGHGGSSGSSGSGGAPNAKEAAGSDSGGDGGSGGAERAMGAARGIDAPHAEEEAAGEATQLSDAPVPVRGECGVAGAASAEAGGQAPSSPVALCGQAFLHAGQPERIRLPAASNPVRGTDGGTSARQWRPSRGGGGAPRARSAAAAPSRAPEHSRRPSLEAPLLEVRRALPSAPAPPRLLPAARERWEQPPPSYADPRGASGSQREHGARLGSAGASAAPLATDAELSVLHVETAVAAAPSAPGAAGPSRAADMARADLPRAAPAGKSAQTPAKRPDGVGGLMRTPPAAAQWRPNGAQQRLASQQPPRACAAGISRLLSAAPAPPADALPAALADVHSEATPPLGGRPAAARAQQAAFLTCCATPMRRHSLGAARLESAADGQRVKPAGGVLGSLELARAEQRRLRGEQLQGGLLKLHETPRPRDARSARQAVLHARDGSGGRGGRSDGMFLSLSQ